MHNPNRVNLGLQIRCKWATFNRIDIRLDLALFTKARHDAVDALLSQ